jgi:hypothetical protein
VDRSFLGHGVFADEAPYREFCDELEAPTSDSEVVAVSSVGVVVVEDGLERFRGGAGERLVADVDPLVREGGEDRCAFATKGAITASEYSSSAASPTSIAMSGCDSRCSRMAGLVTGIGLLRASTSVHDSTPSRT